MSDLHQLTHPQLRKIILTLRRDTGVDGPVYVPSFGVKGRITRDSEQYIWGAIIVLQNQDMWIDESAEFKWKFF